jgi:hypothetical protein
MACAWVSPAQNSCPLNAPDARIQHVIYIQFDNTHLRRDIPNVPSDLEQMPNLLNFIQNNGVLDSNHHAVLISHTADDIVTSITGVYGDRHGISVANSFGAFRPNGSVAFPSSFFYWTDLVDDINSSSKDFTFGMLTATGKNAPAPWVAFTRAGCDVGAFAMDNIIIERPSFDVPKIFGAGSPEAAEDFDHQTADFEGVGVHCALGSPLCSAANHGQDDLLPDEPGGYTGFKALFGAKFVSAALGGPIKDLEGNVIVNADSGLPGFTGFDPLATQSLGYVAAMQEAGIPVTYAYISDAHDDHVSDNAFGPGQQGYVAQLASYNAAFGKFFARLKKDGIDASNTLFIFTADEGDHFAGGPPTPANCDGVNVPCSYDHIGELDLNLNGLVASQTGNSTPFSIHFDDAPTVYIVGNPGPTAPSTRQLERDFSGLTAVNPVTNNKDKLTVALADPAEMGLLHMITADPARTPTFTMFGDADYFFSSFGPTTPVEDPGFAWNHGGIQPEVGQTWLGLVGPGVRSGNGGENGAAIDFSDETDIRPTMMALLGMPDDYTHDGRVLVEALDPSAIPQSLTAHHETLLRLAAVYKQINAPFGQLAMNSLVVSTAALASNTANDAEYFLLNGKITTWRARRDSIAGAMNAILQAAAFEATALDEQQAKQLIAQGEALLAEVSTCASNVAMCQ